MARTRKPVGRGTSPYSAENLLPAGLSLEEKIAKAGLDFQIKEAPAMMPGPDGIYREVPDRKVLYRSDTIQPLSIVSTDYKPVQPDVIARMHQDVFAAGGFHLQSAGAILDGRRIWAMADTGEEMELPGGDKVKGAMFIASSCDGAMSTVGFFTTLRMLCWNMMQRAIADAKKRGTFLRLPHTKEITPELLSDLKGELAQSVVTWKKFATNAKHMAKVKVTEEDAIRYFLSVQGKLDTTETEMSLADQLQRHNANQTMRRMLALFQGRGMGSDVVSSKDTVWGLLNAVTEFVDYYRVSNGPGYRFNNAQLGSGYDLKEVAYQEALKLVA